MKENKKTLVRSMVLAWTGTWNKAKLVVGNHEVRENLL